MIAAINRGSWPRRREARMASISNTSSSTGVKPESTDLSIAKGPGVESEPTLAAAPMNGLPARPRRRISYPPRYDETGRAIQFFFVTGGHKSGTSWVSWMLNSHPEVCCLGAARFLGGLHSAEKWIDETTLREWAEFHTVRLTWLNDVEIDDVVLAARRSMIESAMMLRHRPGIHALGDKTPVFYSRALDDLHALFPEAKLISVMRDGRDVAVSHLFHMLRRGEYGMFENPDEGERRHRYFILGEGDPLPLFTPRCLRRVTQNWAVAVRGNRRAARLFRSNFLELRYESLLVNPWKMAEAFALLGVSTDEDTVHACIDGNAFHKKSGGRKPGQADPNAFVRKGVAGDWKNYFTEDDKRQFKSQAGQLLMELGYAEDEEW